MIFVEHETEKTPDGAPAWRMWASATDGAYGRNPHAEVMIKIGPDLWKRRLPVGDAKMVAQMMRHVADGLDAIAASAAARKGEAAAGLTSPS